MTSQVTQPCQSFNAPYKLPDENNLYELSEGAAYSFTKDYQLWVTSFAINLLFISTVLPYIGFAKPFPLTFLEGTAITALCSSATALTKRLVGFTKDIESERVVDRPLTNFFAFASYTAVALYVIPRVTRLPFEKMSELISKTIWPPFIFTFYSSLSQSSAIEDQHSKIQKIYDSYASHHSKIMKLNEPKQQRIYAGMYALNLQPPKEVIENKPAFLKGFKSHEMIFKRYDPETLEVTEWLKGKANSVLRAVSLPTMPPIEEINETMVKNRVGALSLHEIQWTVLSIACCENLELKDGDFYQLQEKAREIKEDDATGLVEKLKSAHSIIHLKILVKG